MKRLFWFGLVLTMMSASPAAGHALTVPEIIIMQAINNRYNYGLRYREYHDWDFRRVNIGDTGNCAVFAYNKWLALQEAGFGDRAKIKVCTLHDGQRHAFVVVDRVWRLDNLELGVVADADEVCASDVLVLTNPKRWERQ
jgi:predicted transglutaminase-like cysteine proteinase